MTMNATVTEPSSGRTLLPGFNAKRASLATSDKEASNMFTCRDQQNTAYQAYLPSNPSIGYASGYHLHALRAKHAVVGTSGTVWYPGRESYQPVGEGQVDHPRPLPQTQTSSNCRFGVPSHQPRLVRPTSDHERLGRSVSRAVNPIIQDALFDQFIPTLPSLPPNCPLPPTPSLAKTSPLLTPPSTRWCTHPSTSAQPYTPPSSPPCDRPSSRASDSTLRHNIPPGLPNPYASIECVHRRPLRRATGLERVIDQGGFHAISEVTPPVSRVISAASSVTSSLRTIGSCMSLR
jgi:hypothetical protein